MTTLSIPERVANGVRWLDATRPDWPLAVVLTDFDIESPCKCVLGQVFNYQGGYTAGLAERGFDVEDLTTSERWAVDYGFDAPGASEQEWEALQLEWERAIKLGRRVREPALV